MLWVLSFAFKLQKTYFFEYVFEYENVLFINYNNFMRAYILYYFYEWNTHARVFSFFFFSLLIVWSELSLFQLYHINKLKIKKENSAFYSLILFFFYIIFFSIVWSEQNVCTDFFFLFLFRILTIVWSELYLFSIISYQLTKN